MEADAAHGTAAELAAAGTPATKTATAGLVAARSGIWPGTWRAATAYLLVGSLAGVNAAIAGYPVFGEIGRAHV